MSEADCRTRQAAVRDHVQRFRLAGQFDGSLIATYRGKDAQVFAEALQTMAVKADSADLLAKDLVALEERNRELLGARIRQAATSGAQVFLAMMAGMLGLAEALASGSLTGAAATMVLTILLARRLGR